jgi:hypothetical protein
MRSYQRHFPPWSEDSEASWPKHPHPKVKFDPRKHKFSNIRLSRYPNISPSNSPGRFRVLNIGSAQFIA